MSWKAKTSASLHRTELDVGRKCFSSAWFTRKQFDPKTSAQGCTEQQHRDCPISTRLGSSLLEKCAASEVRSERTLRCPLELRADREAAPHAARRSKLGERLERTGEGASRHCLRRVRRGVRRCARSTAASGPGVAGEGGAAHKGQQQHERTETGNNREGKKRARTT